MSTLGKKWTRKDKKWTDEIMDFVKSVCPLREHGINSEKSWQKKSIKDLAVSLQIKRYVPTVMKMAFS